MNVSQGSTQAPSAPTARSPWVVFAIAATGGYITTLDLSIVNVAFAEIAKTYSSASRADLSWIVTIYNIMFASLLIVGGRTADRWGRKNVFMAGAAVFGLGSIMCAIAPSLPLLIVGRGVQGLGGAFLTPATLGILLGAFPPERRTQTVSLWGGVTALGVASGPTLGALLISQFGWRSAFWINLPVILAVIFFGRIVLAESPREHSVGRPDYLGALMITVALGLLALGISESERWGLGDARTIASIAIALVLVPVFIRRQAHHPEPIVDLSLFRFRSFAVANVATMLFFVAFSAFVLNNVLFLRTVWSYSVLRAGLASCLSPLTVAFVSGFSGKYAAKYGFRPLLLGGPIVFCLGIAGNRFLLDSSPTLGLWLFLGVFTGAGIGLTIPVLSSAAVSTLAPQRFAVGSAINSTFRQVGSVIGVAVLVAVQGRPDNPVAALASYRRGWVFVMAAALACAVISIMQPQKSVPVK
jgi:EmrB/QacA subfamily drug resistance transporter